MGGYGVTIHWQGGTSHSRTFEYRCEALAYAQSWYALGALCSIVVRHEPNVADVEPSFDDECGMREMHGNEVERIGLRARAL